MGLNFSSQKLSDLPTINRMRAVCSADASHVPPQLKKFNIQVLANDLNKLGWNIPIRSVAGRELGDDEICDAIYNTQPRPEEVCMSNARAGKTKDQIKKRVVELVKHYNKFYGAQIMVHKNGDPSAPERGIDELCDDIYLVADRVNRALSDNVDLVKQKLLTEIDKLRMSKNLLDQTFARQLGSLQGATNIADAQIEMSNVQALQAGLVGELQRQHSFAEEQYGNLTQNLTRLVNPKMIELDGLIGINKRLVMSRDEAEAIAKVAGLNTILGKSAVAVKSCQACLTKFNIDLAQYYNSATGTIDPAQYINLMNRAEQLKIASGNNPVELSNINTCLKTLLHDTKSCQAPLAQHHKIEEDADKFCLTRTNPQQCNDIPLCSYDQTDTKCKAKKSALAPQELFSTMPSANLPQALDIARSDITNMLSNIQMRRDQSRIAEATGSRNVAPSALNLSVGPMGQIPSPGMIGATTGGKRRKKAKKASKKRKSRK